MTNAPILFLGLLNLGLIGALPRIFFRPGELNVRWWLTAAPFIAAAAALLAAMTGALDPLFPPHPLAGFTAASLHAGSILLIGLTLGTHREPLSLWHQRDDAPGRLITHGAYSRMRHPFYSAFIMALLGAAAASPHPATAAALVFGCIQLNRTAAREEEMLSASPLGPEYRDYVGRTGRFWPRRDAAPGPATPRAARLGEPGRSARRERSHRAS